MKIYISYILFFLLFPVITFSQFSDSENNLNRIQNDTVSLSEQIDVTGFYNGISIADAPSNIYILNEKEINSRNGKNAGEIINSLPGVFIKSYGNQSLQSISINGLGAEQTVILIDGVKINSVQNGQFDLSLIDKNNIKKIELMQNGYSALYGSDAISGVVNIITLDKNSFKKYLNLKTEFGSYNTRKFSFSGNSNINNLNFSLFISNSASDNNFDYYFDNGLERELKSREFAKYFSTEYSFSSSLLLNNFNVKLSSSLLNSDREIPSIETGNQTVKTKQLDKNWNTNLNLVYLTGKSKLSSEFNFQNNLMNYTTLPVINSYYKNISVSNISKLSLDFNNFSSTSGFEIKYTSLESNQLKPGIKRNTYSLFSVSEINFQNFKFFPSLRYEYIDDLKKSVWIYKVGINFKPIPKVNLNLKGNFGNNFAAPTFNALYWKQGGNPDLKPETSENLELGLYYSGSTLLDYKINLSYLKINFKDRIIWIPQRNFIWSPFNIGESISDVFNLGFEISKKLSDDFNFIFGFHFTSNKSIKKNKSGVDDNTYDKQLIYIPEQQIKANTGINYKSLSLNLLYSNVGKRFSDQENLISLSPVNLLDANIKYTFSIFSVESEFKIEINNITNTDYQIISGYPMPLRNYNLNLNLKYFY
ncbi:MAG: TonB-dependent receptor [Ignavibacteria bacterium]|nr:TonB-dependent receptor [Ignavibacteria bacterium]